jgi:hypothetical protein
VKTDLFAPISTRAVRSRPFEWLIEPFFDDPTFRVRPMFGAHGCYLRGRLVIVLSGRTEEEWRGMLVPTARKHHASLLREFPSLVPHEVLAKWLYLAASRHDFEETAQALVTNVCRDDDRIGVGRRTSRQNKGQERKRE